MEACSKKKRAKGQCIGAAAVMAVIIMLACFIGSIGIADAGDKSSDSREMLEQFWLNAYDKPATSSKKDTLSTPPSPLPTPVPLPGEECSATLTRELLAKAKPDECFNGVGNPYPPGPPCPEGSTPKVNQAYVWGLAKSGNNLWLGTAPNVHCLAMGAYGSSDDPLPIETSSWVCEFGRSQYSQNYPYLAPTVGDWRPPHIYVYDTQKKTLTEKTPRDPAFLAMTGIRSAGSLGDIVIMAGPSTSGGIALSAFLSNTGTYLGTKDLSDYTNIRKWLVVDNVLYTSVCNAGGPFKGSVLRWAGELVPLPTGRPDLDKLFRFTVVGNLKDGEGAELAEHEGRIFVTTWPGNLDGGQMTMASLYMSQPIPKGGLTDKNAEGWRQIWRADYYEPDDLTAKTYGGGALASFDGYLYWGTMHVPFLSTMAHFNIYGMPDNPADILAAVLGTYRPISIFRGRNFDRKPEIELVYGMSSLPKYTPPGPGNPSGSWEIVPNKMRQPQPLWGLAGFGNFFNNYTWTMSVYNNQLFIGTMDWSYLFGGSMDGFLDFTIGYVPEPLPQLPTSFYGADLFRVESSSTPALSESISGVGNYTSYGIRTMVSDDALYLGMANPINLLTDPYDDLPEGGWELIKLIVREVPLDIIPGSCPNLLSLSGRKALTVAITGSPDFDVNQINIGTLKLGRAGTTDKGVPVKWSFFDAATPFKGNLCDCHTLRGDGYIDLVLTFDPQQVISTLGLVLAGEEIPLTLTGRLSEENGGSRIKGQDCVLIVY